MTREPAQSHPLGKANYHAKPWSALHKGERIICPGDGLEEGVVEAHRYARGLWQVTTTRHRHNRPKDERVQARKLRCPRCQGPLGLGYRVGPKSLSGRRRAVLASSPTARGVTCKPCAEVRCGVLDARDWKEAI